MFEAKTAGAYVAGRTIGKVAGRIEAQNEAQEQIDIQGMAIDQLRARVANQYATLKAILIGRAYEIANEIRLDAVLTEIKNEGQRIAAHMAKYGSLTSTEFEELAPVTAERKHEERAKRVASNRISKAAVLEWFGSKEGHEDIFAGLEFTAAERSRILERVRAEIEKLL